MLCLMVISYLIYAFFVHVNILRNKTGHIRNYLYCILQLFAFLFDGVLVANDVELMIFLQGQWNLISVDLHIYDINLNNDLFFCCLIFLCYMVLQKSLILQT